MKIKNIIFVAKTAVMAFLSQKIMITRSSIAFEDLLVSSIASQVMPPWNIPQHIFGESCCYVSNKKFGVSLQAAQTST